MRTGNKCEFGERVAPSGSAADVPDCGTSAGGGLIGLSRGFGLVALSSAADFDDTDFRLFEESAPGRVQSSTSRT